MKRSISALVGAVACAAVCAGPAAASTAHTTAATKLCTKVSASTVSSIIGYTVPAATGEVDNQPASKQNDNIKFSLLGCVYGAGTSLKSLKKSVDISVETLSRSVSPAELKTLVAKVESQAGLKVKLTAFPGLGSEAYLMSFSDSGLDTESLAFASGTKLYAATVETSISSSKLVSLAKLAEKL